MSRKNSSDTVSGAGASAADDDEVSAEERAATEADVQQLLAQVQKELVQSGAEHAAQAQAEGHADDKTEEDDKVAISDHFSMTGLTLSEKDDSSNPNSQSNSQSNSVAASPAIAPSVGAQSLAAGASPQSTSSAAAAVAQASALSAVPPVELQDGGNAALSNSNGAPDAHVGSKQNFFDVRVAVVGNVDSGKSTLIGVLTGGALDNGRGLARSKVFIHAHELGTGRTSAISQHIMGFDEQGKPVHQTVAASAQSLAKSKSWAQVVHASRSVMTFIDLAGHEKYLKTTIAGLTGSHPDYAIVIINALAGVTRMTREHLGVVLALEIPLICVVSKVDMAPIPVLEQSKKQLFRILKSAAANRLPMQMRSPADVETVISNSTNSSRLCPVFFISAVDGTHVDLLTHYLSRLRPHHEWLQHYAQHMQQVPGAMPPAGAPSSGTANPTAVEFSIDEVFNVSGIGIVVSGTLNSGTLLAGATLLLGPQSDNTFVAVTVRSLHYKRMAIASVEAGQSCAISIRALKKKETLKRNLIRRGQVLVDPIVNPKATKYFDAEVLILHHPTTIKLGYQAVLHCGMIRQTAQICRISKSAGATAGAAAPATTAEGDKAAADSAGCLRTGDKSICRFRFLLRDEFLHTGASFVFREGSTKGIGKVVRINFTDAERAEMAEEENSRRRPQGKSQQPSAAKLAAAAAAAAGEGAGEVPASAAAATAGALTSTSAAAATPASVSNSHGASHSGHGHGAKKSSSHAGGANGHISHSSSSHAGAAHASDELTSSGVGTSGGGGGGGNKKWSNKERSEYQQRKDGGDKTKK